MLMLELLELELGFVRWGLVFVAIVVVIGVGVEVELVSDVTTNLTHSCRVFVFSVASSGADSSAEIGDLAGVMIIIIKHFTVPLLQLLQLIMQHFVDSPSSDDSHLLSQSPRSLLPSQSQRAHLQFLGMARCSLSMASTCPGSRTCSHRRSGQS